MIWDEQVLCDQGAKQTLPQAGDKGISGVAEPALTESLAAAPLVCGREFVGVCLMVQKAGQLF